MWDFLFYMEKMRPAFLAAVAQNPGFKRILLLGICKDSLVALYLAGELKRVRSDLAVGVLGCFSGGDNSTPEARIGLFCPEYTEEQERKLARPCSGDWNVMKLLVFGRSAPSLYVTILAKKLPLF